MIRVADALVSLIGTALWVTAQIVSVYAEDTKVMPVVIDFIAVINKVFVNKMLTPNMIQIM